MPRFEVWVDKVDKPSSAHVLTIEASTREEAMELVRLVVVPEGERDPN